MDQQHTSDNIRKALQNMVAQWLGEQAGTQEQMGFVVTDGAANMIKALRDGRFVGVRCSAHVLHLVVKAALEDGSNTGRLPALLESCRQIAGHFHRSVKDSQLLREEQKKADLPEHRLKQDVGTRWNSTLDMLERILEQKKAIHAMSCHHFIGSNRTLGRADWALMEQVVTVLTPFRALTELLSKENASLAEVIPLFTHLSLKLDDFLSHRERLPGAEGNILPDVAALLTRLKKELTRRMEERMDNCPELMLATICDPRIKGKLALRSNSLTAWREQLIARVHERQRKTRMQSQEVGGDSEDELEECGETDIPPIPVVGTRVAMNSLLLKQIFSKADQHSRGHERPKETDIPPTPAVGTRVAMNSLLLKQIFSKADQQSRGHERPKVLKSHATRCSLSERLGCRGNIRSEATTQKMEIPPTLAADTRVAMNSLLLKQIFSNADQQSSGNERQKDIMYVYSVHPGVMSDRAVSGKLHEYDVICFFGLHSGAQ
ncbi:uncharacterized protein WCC33_006376 [Rhinophrynus dorsalis]